MQVVLYMWVRLVSQEQQVPIDSLVVGDVVLVRPGERLDEQALAQRFEVSRTPVREALQELAALGLATQQAHRGSFVADVTLEDVFGSYEVLAELEVRGRGGTVERAGPRAPHDLVGGARADDGGGARRDRARIDRGQVPARRQHIGTATRRRAGRAGRHAAAVQQHQRGRGADAAQRQARTRGRIQRQRSGRREARAAARARRPLRAVRAAGQRLLQRGRPAGRALHTVQRAAGGAARAAGGHRAAPRQDGAQLRHHDRLL